MWLDSPSKLAVVTKHVLSSLVECRSIKSQGKVSSSITSTISPTCLQKYNQTDCFPGAEVPEHYLKGEQMQRSKQSQL